jgi:transglutaminase-like putative cysteine protease
MNVVGTWVRLRPRYACRLLAIVAVASGCNSPPAATTARTGGAQPDPTAELVESIREDLRKSPDPPTSRRLVEQLNSYLPRASAERRPAPLSAEERTVLQRDFALRPEEITQVARSEFTPVDAYYLDETFLLRDIARSLDVDRLNPVARAEAALAWVVRNLRGVAASGPAMPVGFVVTRGAGTPLERTYVLLALLSHLGLDAALIGDANSGPDGVWAVGVLTDGQVYLFDARLGLPLPGPDSGVLTLAQARSLADPFQPLAIDPKLPYDVTADRAKRAEVLVTVPLSALSSRMRLLQEMIGTETARLTADPVALADRFRKAAAPVRLWCPPAADAVPRLLFAFVPAADGGGDNSPPEKLRIRQFLFDLVPFELLPQYLRIGGEPGDRVRSQFMNRVAVFSDPGQAHDLIVRGQFREATDQLVAAQSRAKHRPGNPAELAKYAEEWANAARRYTAAQSRRERGAGDPAALAQMDVDKQLADQLWQSNRGPQAYLEYLVAEPLAAQATYLLGLCKHEEAERKRDQPDAARPAWATAQQWWRSFLSGYPSSPWAPAARRNLASALERGGQTAAARGEYTTLADSAPTPLEKLACRYLAEKSK